MRRPIAATPGNAMTLATHMAIKEIKAALRRAGIKVGEIERGEMRRRARDYLTPELVAKATAVLLKVDPE